MASEAQVIGYIGPPRSGKSDLALHHLAELRKREMVLAVDANGDIPDHLFDGVSTHIRRTTLARMSVVRDAGLWRVQGHPLYTLTDDPDRALRWSRAHSRPRNPMALYIDEAVAMDAMSPHRIGGDLRRYLGQRRHTGVSLLYGSQYPRQIHYALIALSSGLYLWRMTAEDDLARLRQGGVPDDALRVLPILREHECVYVPMLSPVSALPIRPTCRVWAESPERQLSDAEIDRILEEAGARFVPSEE